MQSYKKNTNIELPRKDYVVVYSDQLANELSRWSLSCGYKLTLDAC